jgi:hypothetical protein
MLGNLLCARLQRKLACLPRDLGREACLADVSRFTTVAADGNTRVMNKAGIEEALEVLLGALGPALRHLGTTRLAGQLNGEDIFALGVTDQVDNGHVGSNLLLLSDEEDAQVVRA